MRYKRSEGSAVCLSCHVHGEVTGDQFGPDICYRLGHMRDYHFFVYIMASKSRVIYVGITTDLAVRVFQHKNGRYEGFTQRYKMNRLVYFESHRYVNSSIEREKELKGWRREKRVALIESINPLWEDLARDWFTAEELARDPYAPVKIEFDSSRVLTFSNRMKNESESLASSRIQAVPGEQQIPHPLAPH